MPDNHKGFWGFASKIIEDVSDLCALILVIGGLSLWAAGIDGETKSIVLMSAGWIFRGKAPKILGGTK